MKPLRLRSSATTFRSDSSFTGDFNSIAPASTNERGGKNFLHHVVASGFGQARPLRSGIGKIDRVDKGKLSGGNTICEFRRSQG